MEKGFPSFLDVGNVREWLGVKEDKHKKSYNMSLIGKGRESRQTLISLTFEG